MAKTAYGKFKSGIAQTESGYRSKLANILNMAGPSQDISMATAGNTELSFADVPSVASLANMQANLSGQSIGRQEQGGRLIKGLPDYEKSYGNYLRWRYPSRYGRSSGSTYNYGPTGSGAINVPSITTPINPAPGYGS